MKIDIADITYLAGSGLIVAGFYQLHGQWAAAIAGGILLVVLSLPRVMTK